MFQLLVWFALIFARTLAETCTGNEISTNFAGEQACTDCGEGWKPNPDRTYCVKDEGACPAGTYIGISADSMCSPCALGSWSPGNVYTCTRCPDGTTTLKVGSASPNDCVREPEEEDNEYCPPGTKYDTSTKACIFCEENTYSLGGVKVISCTPCPDGSVSDEGAKSVDECRIHNEPVDGVWSEWGDWSECSAECGEQGQQIRTRDCTQPQHGGEPCEGSDTQHKTCSGDPCPQPTPCTPGGDCVCGENFYSLGDSCTPCPDSKFSDAGATSADECYLRDARIEATLTGPVTATLSCIDAVTGMEIATATFFNNGQSFGNGEVELMCESPDWSCFAAGYNTVTTIVNIPEYRQEFSTTGDIIEVGSTITLDIGDSDTTLTVDWYKAAKLHGSSLIARDSTSISVSEAGRYTAKIYRCSDHKPSHKAFNIVTKETDFVPTNKVCSVYGDPHIRTFDGAHYSFQGECMYILAMDCAAYRWYVYGKFTACGDGVTCLSSLNIYSTADAGHMKMFEVKRGFGINVDGVMLGVAEGEEMSVAGARITFDGIYLTVDIANSDVKVIWDGLAFTQITVSMEARTCGVCSDNDGSAANDMDHYMFTNMPELSFADTWALTPNRGGCGVNSVDVEAGASAQYKDSLSSLLNEIEGSPFSDGDLVISEFIADAAFDRAMATNMLFGDKFMECTCMRAMVRYMEDTAGITLDRWDIDMGCPSPREILVEGVRLGCPWTKFNAPFYIM